MALIVGIVLAIVVPIARAKVKHDTGPAMRLRYIHPEEPYPGLARIALPEGTRLVISERRHPRPGEPKPPAATYRQLRGSDGTVLYVPAHALDRDGSQMDALTW